MQERLTASGWEKGIMSPLKTSISSGFEPKASKHPTIFLIRAFLEREIAEDLEAFLKEFRAE
jgi:hypothetical protein